ncbi:MAG: C2HC-type zinc finger protein, partial [Acidobacteriaceae bacterium]
HARDVAVSHMGTDLLNQFAEYQGEFKGLTTDSDKKKFKEKFFEAWIAYLVIRGSDQSKYGSLTANFVQQYSLGNDQYPRTIEMATDVLSQHRFDSRFYEDQKKHHVYKQNKKAGEDGVGATSFAQKDKSKDLVCFICGKPGHRSPQCPEKDSIPRNQWAIKKAMAGMQSKGKEDANNEMSQISRDESIKTSTCNRSVHHKKTEKGWSGLTVSAKAQSVAQCTDR